MPKLRFIPGQGEQPDHTTKPEEKAMFVEWLAMPKSERVPSSQNKMAAQLGVTPQTLRNWKRDPRVIAQLKGHISGAISVNDLSDLVANLKVIALDPDNPRAVQATKQLLEIMEKGETATDKVPLEDLSNAELKELAAVMFDRFDEAESAS